MTPRAQIELVAQAALGDLLCQQQGVARGRGDNGRAQVLHHLELFFGVARAHGNGHGAQALGAQLETDAGRPQAVARGNLDAVLRGDAGRAIAAGEHLGPVINILLGVGDDHGRAGSAG